MYSCQQVLIKLDNELKAVLEFICSESHKLTNCGIYYARQMYFKTKTVIGKFDLEKEYKTNKHFQVLYSQAAQQILRSVAESFKSFKELNKKYRKGELKDKPMLPNYRKKGGLTIVTYPKQALKLVDNQIRIPLGKTVKRWFALDSFSLRMPSNFKFEDIRELRILPRNQCFYAEFVYEQKPVVKHEVDFNKALSIDSGVTNWLSCITNTGFAFIVDERKVKSLNQWYNKRVSTLKEGKPQGYWDEQLAHITEKRNRQMRDAVNKAARIIVNYCLEHQIGAIIFGWNQGQRQECSLGKSTQSFVQIPTAKVKERIKQLCEQYGIKFVETEESYTSKSSFLDNDFLPKFGEKPEGWKANGKRIFRGLYKTKTGKLINCDLNGAANILRKVEVQLGLDLTEACMAFLTVPPRLKIWDSKKKKTWTRSATKSRGAVSRGAVCGGNLRTL